jgi:hypothetical protein
MKSFRDSALFKLLRHHFFKSKILNHQSSIPVSPRGPPHCSNCHASRPFANTCSHHLQFPRLFHMLPHQRLGPHRTHPFELLRCHFFKSKIKNSQSSIINPCFPHVPPLLQLPRLALFHEHLFPPETDTTIAPDLATHTSPPVFRPAQNHPKCIVGVLVHIPRCFQIRIPRKHDHGFLRVHPNILDSP